MSVKIELNFTNKTMYTFIVIGLLAIFTFGVCAVSVDPSIHGHPDQIVAPTGAIMAFNLTACPTGWTIADGTQGTPDLQGQFIRGLDIRGNVDPDRELGDKQLDSIPSHYHTIPITSVKGDNGANGVQPSQPNTNGEVVYISGESRPKNIALLYCMKE